MGGACSTYGGSERCRQGCGGGDLRERDHLEDLDVDAGYNNGSKGGMGAWTGLTRHRIGTGSGFLCME
jgi:hypothetical protein